MVLRAIGRVAFPAQAEGSLYSSVRRHHLSDRAIAQKFTRPEYFQPRPSGVDYNAASTGGTSYGPSNPETSQGRARAARCHYQAGWRHGRASAPSEMVTASGGGMDPHIPPAAAALQAGRVASARGIPVDRVRDLIQAHAEPRRRSGFWAGPASTCWN